MTMITVATELGQGRAFILLRERGIYPLAEALVAPLAERARVLLVECDAVRAGNWQALVRGLVDMLQERGIRQASFVGFGAGSALVQDLALRELKLVRTLVLVDAETRPHATRFDRIIDRLEEFFPLGLPLRARGRWFDVRPFLHRVRCPTLVVTTPQASPHTRAEAAIFARHLPTGWGIELQPEGEAAELCGHLLRFQDVSAKCPQRRVAA